MKDKEAQRAYARKWYRKNKSKFKKKAKLYYRKIKDTPEFKRRQKDYTLKKDFGISLAQYEALADSQEWICAICREPDKSGKQLAVDHDHLTGRVRGLLCRRCNQGIGLFEDRAALLSSASDYLKGYKSWANKPIYCKI